MRTADRPIPLKLDPDRLQRDAVRSLSRAVIATGRAALDQNVRASDVARQWDDHNVELVLRAAVSPTSMANSVAMSQVGAAFLSALVPASAGAALLARGVQLNFAGAATIGVPNVASPAADFVAENQPFPVRTAPTSAGATLSVRKLGVIVVLTGEVLRSSNAEILVRATLVESCGPAVDKILFSAGAAAADRPAGLLNGIAGLTPTAAAGNKGEVLVDDIQKLATALGPVAGNGAIALIGSPDVAVALALRIPSHLDWPVLMSSSLAPRTIIAVASAAVASAIDGAPAVDARQETGIHMADPASPTIDGVTPVGSTFQCDAVAVRLKWSISWALRDPRGVAHMTGVNW
jgi:Phage capsid family